MTPDERLSVVRTKIERANQHLGELVVIRDSFMQTKPYTILSRPNTQPGYYDFYVTDIHCPPKEIALITGDVIHNLRAALDHLAYELVLLNGAEPTTATCFPIHDDAALYNSRHERQVRGMGQPAIDAISATQPYKGGNDALWVLHKLDIEDKHHALFVAIVSVTQMVLNVPQSQFWQGLSPSFALPNFMKPLKEGDVVLVFEPDKGNDMELTFDICIDQPKILDPKPIVVLLTLLIKKVDDLVISFKPLLG